MPSDSFKSETTLTQGGLYKKAFGENYRLIVSVNNEEEVSFAEYMKNWDADRFVFCNVNADDISEVLKIPVDVKTYKDKKVSSADVYVVKTGMFRHVDNTVADTSSFINKILTELLYKQVNAISGI